MRHRCVRRTLAILISLVALAGAAGSCSRGDEPVDDSAVEAQAAEAEVIAPEAIDDCLPGDQAEGDRDAIEYQVAYRVADGELGDVCFGAADATVEGAWGVLADLTPTGQLRDLATFAGFGSSEDPEDVTLAFVQALDDDGATYLMAVNIDETENDPDEATLTMAHEFTHVFTALPFELDRTIEPAECETFDNGEGCYAADSILNQWFDEFWQDAPGDPTDERDGDTRCFYDAGFFGSYAATTPEEDFAEAFSAYVLQVEAKTPGQQARLDWIDAFPGLREFRDRAVEQGYGPLENKFDDCG